MNLQGSVEMPRPERSEAAFGRGSIHSACKFADLPEQHRNRHRNEQAVLRWIEHIKENGLFFLQQMFGPGLPWENLMQQKFHGVLFKAMENGWDPTARPGPNKASPLEWAESKNIEAAPVIRSFLAREHVNGLIQTLDTPLSPAHNSLV